MRTLAVFLLALVVMSMAVPTAGAQTIKLSFANFPAAATFPCVSMERWAQEVKSRTNNVVQVETYPGGILLDARSMFRGVIQGQADIGCISTAYHPGVFPMLSVFELPLGFNSAESASRIMWDFYASNQPKELAQVKVLAVFTSAPSQIMSTKPVNSLQDVKGLRLRAAGMLAEVVRQMDASAVSMPQSEAPEALQKGVVEGILSSLDVFKDYNYAELCRHGLMVDMPVYPFVVFMNQDCWDDLPPEVQQVLDDLAREHSIWTGNYVDGHAREARQWGLETYGSKLIELSDDDRNKLQMSMEPVIAGWIEKADAKGFDGAAIVRQVKSMMDSE